MYDFIRTYVCVKSKCDLLYKYRVKRLLRRNKVG
nr:MAG TPA: hypothetical protein [Caudoviricetes sp.]